MGGSSIGVLFGRQAVGGVGRLAGVWRPPGAGDFYFLAATCRQSVVFWRRTASE